MHCNSCNFKESVYTNVKMYHLCFLYLSPLHDTKFYAKKSPQPTFVGCGPPHQLSKQQLTPPPPSHPSVMEGCQERGGSTTTCADSPCQQQSGNLRTVTPPPLLRGQGLAGQHAGPTLLSTIYVCTNTDTIMN